MTRRGEIDRLLTPASVNADDGIDNLAEALWNASADDQTYAFWRLLSSAPQSRPGSRSSASGAGGGPDAATSSRTLKLLVSSRSKSPTYATNLAAAIVAAVDDDTATFSALAQLFRSLELSDFQICLVTASILCRPSNKLRDEAVSELLARFPTALRQIGIKSQSEDLTPEELARLARQLLLTDACARVLSQVQKFVVEYALFQRYPTELPREVQSFFDEYNRARAPDDAAKSLAQLFEDTRGAATSTVTSAEQLLIRKGISARAPQLAEAIAELITSLLSSPLPPNTWNGDRLARALHKHYPELDWAAVLKAFDRPNFHVGARESLALLMSILKTTISLGHTAPIQVFWARWEHGRAQAQLLHHLTQAPPGVFQGLDFTAKRVLTADDFVSAPANIKNLAQQLETSPWNNLDLLQTSLQLLSVEDAAGIAKGFLEAAGKARPELIFLGCVQLPQPWSPQQEQLSEKGFEVFFAGQSNHQLVFYRLWQVSPEFFCRKIIDVHDKNSVSVARIFEIAQELHVLEQLLILQSHSFTLDLAAYAASQDALNFDKWLEHRLAASSSFVEACLNFLNFKAEAENMLQHNDPGSQPATVSLRVDTVAAILKTLMNSAMSPENGDFLKQVQTSCLQVYPRLMNSSNAHRSNNEPNGFAKDVEKEVEYYYGRLYEGEMSIASFIEMLQSLKRSSNHRDHDVFACMLHSLFDEYRFFADYPLSALKITAMLFGSLIQNQLLSYIPLGIALRYILDAVSHDVESNMFKFGVQALEHFRERVPEWPQYCQQILAVNNLAEQEPELIDMIRRKARSVPQTKSRPQSSAEDTVKSSRGDVFARPTFRSIDSGPNPKSADPYSEPDVETSDKILFNVNNLSLTNLSEKMGEIKSALSEHYFAWFAKHLVTQRAAVEPNYHSLYIHLLEGIDSAPLEAKVLQETLSNISILLNAPGTVTSTVERQNLKNLGAWLGGLTLARNKPLLHKRISLKDLLLEGYDNTKLIVVLPFICRVMEQVQESKVFKPPNPWTMAVLALLQELYENADMKLNLKFEVEVLCKKLDIQMSDIKASDILDKRPEMPDETEVVDAMGQMQLDDAARQQADANAERTAAFVSRHAAEMPIAIHPTIQQTFAMPDLRQLLQIAAERAIREFILPVVERSVAIASISTSQLITKDFALEEDVRKLRQAAHIMNQNLAGSLATVTCKEPLRGAFMNNLRALLAQNGYEGLSQDGELLLSQLISDNLDAACTVVEQAAKEKAISEIDEGLRDSFQARQRHAERNDGQRFVDDNAPRHNYPLPDSLRLKPTGLAAEQLALYEDFARIPRTANDAANYYAKDETRAAAPEPDAARFRNEQQSAAMFEQLLGSIAEVEELARQQNVATIDELPEDSQLKSLYQQILSQVPTLTGPRSDERTLACAQRVCQLMFKMPFHELASQCLTALLSAFIELSLKTYRDVSVWLVHSDDPRKYNVPVIKQLIRAGVIAPMEFDVQLAKHIQAQRASALEFAVDLLREVLLGDPPVSLRSDFAATLDAFHNLSQFEDVKNFLQQLKGASLIPPRSASGEILTLKDQVMVIYTEWLHLLNHSVSSPRLHAAFVLQLEKTGLLRDRESCLLFFRTMLEQAAEAALRLSAGSAAANLGNLSAMDGVTKLTVLLVQHGAANQTTKERLRVLETVLDVVVLVYGHARQKTKDAVLQRPFSRFFSTLLSELSEARSQLGDAYMPALHSIVHILLIMQPSHFPDFTFAWISLMSHRFLMPRLLAGSPEADWDKFADLVSALLRFMAPQLEQPDMANHTRLIYQATLRVMLVLLNDFPSFLTDFHHTFCNILPAGCIQLRNLILSAFPRNLLLPDPFLPGLKVDRLPETALAPRIAANLDQILSAGKVMTQLNSYIYSGSAAVVQKLIRAVTRPNQEAQAQPQIDGSLLSSLVLYAGTQAMGTEEGPPVFEVNSPWVSLIQDLFKALGPAGRYRLLCALVDQLRYPNKHTYFFSCVLLLLFSTNGSGGEQDIVAKEQITRVLLERLICNRPHPWGLLITFTELLKNQKYGIWNLEFIRAQPEIQALVQSLFTHINSSIVSSGES